MNIVDYIMIAFLLLFALKGFRRGLLPSIVNLASSLLVFVIAFYLKTPISTFLYENLPFFKFGGLTSLNIIMYEALAFMICLTVLTMTLSLIIKISNIIEKLLDITIIFALPSKILGLVVGLIQTVVILYVALFILSMPVFDVPFLSESKYAPIILSKTPIVSTVTNDAIKTFDEIAKFTKNEININDVDNTNGKIVDIMLKNDIVKIDSINLLNEKEKIKLINLDELVNKYKED